jgi:uncharacterized caspase-like protein
MRKPYGTRLTANQARYKNLSGHETASLGASDICSAHGLCMLAHRFFAGHGVVEGERDGYLLAYDSDPQNLYATTLPISELDRIITERLRARVVVLMADACHAGRIGWTSRGAAGSIDPKLLHSI